MTTLPLHLQDLEHRAAVLHLSILGLRNVWATYEVARVDFDAVLHSAEKLKNHIQGVRLECEDAEGSESR